MSNELQKLILKYAVEDISYAEFRRLFASALVNPRSIDEEQLAYKAESLCADLSEQFINEDQLRRKLVALCPMVAEIVISSESAFRAASGNSSVPMSNVPAESGSEPKLAEYAVA